MSVPGWAPTLFRENQLVVARKAQPVFLAIVLDADLLRVIKQYTAVDDAGTRRQTLRRRIRRALSLRMLGAGHVYSDRGMIAMIIILV